MTETFHRQQELQLTDRFPSIAVSHLNFQTGGWIQLNRGQNELKPDDKTRRVRAGERFAFCVTPCFRAADAQRIF